VPKAVQLTKLFTPRGSYLKIILGAVTQDASAGCVAQWGLDGLSKQAGRCRAVTWSESLRFKLDSQK
jgi:hypothetical protein